MTRRKVPQTCWISVEDAFPRIDVPANQLGRGGLWRSKRVLVKLTDGRTDEDWYSMSRNNAKVPWFHYFYKHASNVTHWCPLRGGS